VSTSPGVRAMIAAEYPALDHLVSLTDDTGLIQHAVGDIPNRSTGYCTDDVARALIVAVDAAGRPATTAVGTRLVTIYLAYLHDAQTADGWFHNFLGYDRTWQDRSGPPDSFGRALWGLGVCARFAPRPSWRKVATRLVTAAFPHVAQLVPVRSRAYAALGLVHALAAAPAGEREPLRTALEAAVAGIADEFVRCGRPDWRWCEEVMTYDNARLCEALLRGGDALGMPHLVDIGIEMLDFFAAVTMEDGVFVPVGSNGWYPRGGVKARYGQQPLEAAGMVDAAMVAYDLGGDDRFRAYTESALAWYVGGNTAHARMVEGGGCRDGIDEHGVSHNMGAESTVSYLQAAIAVAGRATRPLRVTH
jgi:hypothetical protein